MKKKKKKDNKEIIDGIKVKTLCKNLLRWIYSKEGLDSELVLTPHSRSHSQMRITFKNTHSQRKERT